MMRRIAKNKKLIFTLPFFKKNKMYGYNPYDYLLSMIAPAYEHIVPLQKDSFFFNSNRVEKIPHDETAENNNHNIKPTKFLEYPFFNNEILFLEICRFNRFLPIL